MQPSVNAPQGEKRLMKRAHQLKTEIQMASPSLQGAAGVILEQNCDQLTHLNK